jgi:DNA-binding SARP family transcriptional activator
MPSPPTPATAVITGTVRVLTGLMTRLVKVTLLGLILAGVPYGLATQIPLPPPTSAPTLSQIEHLLTDPVTDTLVLQLLAAAGWVLWGAFAGSILIEAIAAIRGLPVPRLAPIAPVQALAGWLLTGVTAGLLVAAPVIGGAAFAPTAVAAGSEHSRARTEAAAAPAQAAARLTHQIARGDWLGAIAERYLGRFDRYHDIQALNTDLIPDAAGPDGPDHIQPGWPLILPADARDRGLRPHATGRLLTPPRPTPPASAEQPPDPCHAPRPAPPPAPPAPAPPSPSASPTTASPGSHTAAPDPARPDPTGPGTGVDVPGGWVTIPFAAALVSAAATVWLRRRHRYAPGPLTGASLEDPDLRPLPRIVARLRRAVREQAADMSHPPPQPQPTVAEYADHQRGGHDHPQPAPPIGPSGLDLAGLTDLVPAGGLGLTGPGAEPGTRALLIAALSAGGPADPDARGQVVIPAAALTTLLGADAVDVGPIPRLAVTPTLSDALTLVEELLLERRRLLEGYEASDLDQMRAADPCHPPMPPVLLLAETPPPQLRARLSTTLHLGDPLQISAVLLGDWARGETLTVQADGHTNAADGRRLPVLDVPTSVELLHLLREAHTGQPAPAPPPEPASQAEPAPASPSPTPDPATAAEPEPAEASPADPPATHPSADPDIHVHPVPRPRREQVRIRVLGTPTVLDRDGNPVPGLRHHATELLVYLAVHRAGADLSEIMEAFWPQATVRRAGERLSTEAGNLRRCIRQAAGDTSIQPVVNTGGHYHLDPDLLDIDAWALTDALQRAAATTDPADRVAALRQAVDAHTGMLAEGCDYDWIEEAREQHRRHGIRARLHLADLLAAADPRQAAELTQDAAQLDPYSEDIARRAIRALARDGDTGGVRAQLQTLRAAVDDIDEVPSTETIELAAQLQRDASARVHDRRHRADGLRPTDPGPLSSAAEGPAASTRSGGDRS